MVFSGCLDSLVHIRGNDVGVAPTKGGAVKIFVCNYLTRHHPTGISGSATDKGEAGVELFDKLTYFILHLF